MAPEKTSKAPPAAPPTVVSFYEKEDRLAQNLSNEAIHSELTGIVDYMRTKIGKFGHDAEAWKGADAAKLRDGLLVKAIMLRRLNRLSNFRNRLLRERLATSRAKVDAHFLQLQNMRSEIDHLKRAIETCLEFQSMDSEIDLISVEEFYERAPDTISRPEVTKEDEHQLHLARLTFELEERKNMLGNLQELEGRKSVLLSDIHGKEVRLRQIKPKISALKQSARPLLDILGLRSVDASAFEAQKKFAHLPMQLETVSLSAGVYNELFHDQLEIGYEGDVRSAVRFVEAEEANRRRAKAATLAVTQSDEDDEEEDDDEDEDEEDDDVEMEDEDRNAFDDRHEVSKSKKKSRKRKGRGKKDVAKMAETPTSSNCVENAAHDSSTLPSLTANGVVGSGSVGGGRGNNTNGKQPSLKDRFQQKREILLNTHPISLTITIPVPSVPGHRGLKVRLCFVYLSELNCVSLKCKLLDGEILNWQILDTANLLDELYDGDFGRKCTNPTANALLKTLDTSIVKYALLVGRPYNFVEKLCGFAGFTDATAAAASSKSQALLDQQQQQRPMAERQIFELFADMVERVRSRVVSRLKLAECVESLEKNKHVVLSPQLQQRHFPSKVLSKLTDFQPISAENALAFDGLSPAQKSLLNRLAAGGELGTFYYKMVVERCATTAKFVLDALVRVPVAYPCRAPLFLLVVRSTECFRQSLDYMAGIAELERFVNTLTAAATISGADERRAKSSDSRASSEGAGGGGVADELLAFQTACLCSRLDVVLEVTAQRIAAGAQPEFALEHSFASMARGAMQSLPFAFDHRTNAFCFELSSSMQ